MMPCLTTVAIGISVWPLPSHYSSGNKVLWIVEDVEFTYVVNNTTVMSSLFPGLKALKADNIFFGRAALPTAVGP